MAGNYGGAKGSGIIETSVKFKGLIVEMLVADPKVSGGQVMRDLGVALGGDSLPSHRTVQRFMKQWKAAHKSLKRRRGAR